MLNNVKSILILKKIFANVKNKRKLNFIKYNKRITKRLDINKEYFERFARLKKFNIKFNQNIEDTDIEELNLSQKYINKEELKYLAEVKFKELKVLNLKRNNLTDISMLKDVNFNELKVLILTNNYISNIDILEKVNFEKLIELNLSNNKVSNIDIL